MNKYQADIIIAGGGIAGLVTAYELIKKGKHVIIFDKDIEENLGGLAKESMGGLNMIGTPEQLQNGIHDSPELAYKDWLRRADFQDDEHWPREWAKFYCYNSLKIIYEYALEIGVKFSPVVAWPERGLFRTHNTLPRFHAVEGAGFELINKITAAIDLLPHRGNSQIFYEHEVNDVKQGEGVAYLFGTDMKTGERFEAMGKQVVIASGGIGGGDLSTLKKYWPKEHKAPEYMLNGAHKYGDGLLQHKLEAKGGVLTNLECNWVYAAGVHHPGKRKPFDGLSLWQPASALFFNAVGERIGPIPLMQMIDGDWMIDQILQQPGQYTWMVMNWTIALKELGVSLSRYARLERSVSVDGEEVNPLSGSPLQLELLLKEAPDEVLLADTLDDLVDKMQSKNLYGLKINQDKFKEDIKEYDDQIDRGPAYHNDEQLRRIANLCAYPPKVGHICEFQKINDPSAGPLVAVRSFLITRKSMGGIQTDLSCRALKTDGKPFGNIYAVGEAAGYGGGGIHGRRGSEGTWLGGCILTARVCGLTID
jgi:predicted oxidoreductase